MITSGIEKRIEKTTTASSKARLAFGVWGNWRLDRFITAVCGGLTMAVFLATGCGGEVPAGSTPETEDVQAKSAALLSCGFSIPDGYYRAAGEPNIYRLSGSQSCWVKDPGQDSALQHRTQAQWDGFSGYADFDLRNCWRNYQGNCHYPAGMYRAQNTNPVYFLTSGSPTGTYCHVVDNAQVGRLGGWNQVLVVQTPADFSETGWLDANGVPHTGRTYTGDCTY